MTEQTEEDPWSDFLEDLDATIPLQPFLDIQFDSPICLWNSIKRLKPYKAAGADGWHSEELQSLTWTMVQDLSTLIRNVWHFGLTQRFMQARTLLFAKRDNPTSIADGRPITILGYLARLCSKMISDQILSQWATLWPPEISGGLPRRSARDLSLMQQLQIEHAKAHHTAWGGWTMELVKAFNLIPRKVVSHVFKLLGIPSHVTDFWFKSLTRLTRALQCGKALGPAHLSTTGLPEGDSMSVVGMLALSFVFYSKLRSPRLFPYAYADNWSFMSTSDQACFSAMTTILNLITSLKMQIDFKKSWCWATTKQFQTFWKEASALLMDPKFVFQIKSHAHDLGCTISYNNAVVLGPLRDKIDNAVAKCNRLRRFNLPLDEKAEKIQVAIWPAVFYGALGIQIGHKHFVSLRRAAASVLVGDHKHASSVVALHYLSDRVTDPLLYIITDILTTLRRMYIYYPKMANQFTSSVRAFEGKIRGPASALAAYLKHLQWELTSNATLLGPGGLRVSIPSSSNKQIRAQLRIAWDWYCYEEILHRKGVSDCPFDSTSTIRLLKKFTDRQRRILSLSLTSGWQSLGAIANWSATQDPMCPWCQTYDTHCHQILECPEFHDLRQNHTEAISFMQQNRRTCWFPLPVHHHCTPMARQAMFLRNCTSFATHPQIIPPGPGTFIYTDGSCDDTRDPYTARAAWAVVFSHPHPLDAEFRNYSVSACGHCPGPQTINRSELFAMVIAVEQVQACQGTHTVLFVTDSQFVCNIIEEIQNETIFRHPHKQAHWDLVQRLLELWDTVRFRILKIHSHKDLISASSHIEAWHIHGNSLADEVAGKVRKTDDTEFSQICTDIKQHRLSQLKIFENVYKYLVDLALMRMAKQEKDLAGSSSRHTTLGPASQQAQTAYQKQMTKLRGWIVRGSSFVMPPEPHRVVFWSCPWGTNLARLIWTYCGLLLWPHPDEAPAPGEQGISWTELAISFMLWAQCRLPVRIKENSSNIILPYDDEKTQLLPVKQRSIRILAENFRWIIKHIQTFSKTNIIPQYKKQGTTSLIRLGFTPYHEGGISRRPNLPNVSQTYDFIHDLLSVMPHNPPYNTEVYMPPVPESVHRPTWPNWPEIAADRRENFLQNVRNAHFRKKGFDHFRHPNTN